MRTVKVSIVRADKRIGATLIPEIWLVGACHTRRLQGMSYQAALMDAIKYWTDQETLQVSHESSVR